MFRDMLEDGLGRLILALMALAVAIVLLSVGYAIVLAGAERKCFAAGYSAATADYTLTAYCVKRDALGATVVVPVASVR